MECAGFLWSNHWGIVRLLIHLGVSGAIIWCFLLMGGVMLSCWGGMLEISSASLCILECRCQVVLLHIPTLVWLKVYSAGPVLGYLVFSSDCCNKVVCVFFITVLDSKFINRQGEICVPVLVCTESWGDIFWCVPIRSEMFLEYFVGDDFCFYQTAHYFLKLWRKHIHQIAC